VDERDIVPFLSQSERDRTRPHAPGQHLMANDQNPEFSLSRNVPFQTTVARSDLLRNFVKSPTNIVNHLSAALLGNFF
jgi:hypothetical protein